MVVHFIGFRGDEYNRAKKIWGEPDFIHPVHDKRAYVEIDNKLILGLQQEVDIAIDKWVKDNSYLDLNFPVVKLSVDEVSNDWIRHQFRTEEFDKTTKSVKNTVVEKMETLRLLDQL